MTTHNYEKVDIASKPSIDYGKYMATHPDKLIKNASVSASAGTGKTWLLVSRIITLLLYGVKPNTILAITFTRKAAAEMYSRLSERLLFLASCNKEQLDSELKLIGIEPRPEILGNARQLYEKLLHRVQSVKTTTFHAFCSDLLTRFPLEADIPPAFGLAELTIDLQNTAWDGLLNETTNNPDTEVAKSLEILFESCNGVYNTHSSLTGFLNHRSDWWAYTENQSDPVDFACKNLLIKLHLKSLDNPLAEFFTQDLDIQIDEFTALLAKHQTNTNLKYGQRLVDCKNLVESQRYDQAFDLLISAFFTQSGTPIKRKESNAQKKNMGDAGEQQFLEIHHFMCEKISAIKAQLLTIETYKLNRAWYQAGHRLLHYYQALKSEQRLLDFSDLEWKAYKLLNHSENAHWIQYKLDERIDHLLIDEFQDTNPTQWQLVKPLLDEMENTEYPGERSIFLVGDQKQSIYRFRRADPELFKQAQQLLQTRLNAETLPLETSWRSSPAIINFVNQIFSNNAIGEIIPDFPKHATHLKSLWGYVELLPLATETDAEQIDADTHTQLRNPLHTPRIVKEDHRHDNEAKLVAEKIVQLISTKTVVGNAGQERGLKYSDIIILLRNRTHAESYEQALREAGIPYIGAGRGTLLESQEIKDIIALLQVLSAPFNNLSLATVLRSPLFSCTDADLMLLASSKPGTWRERLSDIVNKQPEHTRLCYADQLLSKWSTDIDTVPVHDLLDRIYFEGNVIRRYESAYPDYLNQRVATNLSKFLELSLELDSGRYPSIGKFLARFSTVEMGKTEEFDEAPEATSASKVRVMTIHAAKGLEAPVIFIVDASNVNQTRQSYQALVSWPSHSRTPTDFIIVGKKQNQDDYTSNIIKANAPKEQRENYNLLYVAATRARQLLFISGTTPRRGDDLGWYGIIQQQYATQDTTDSACILEQFASPPATTITSEIKDQETKKPVFDKRLTQAVALKPKQLEIKPSEMVNERPYTDMDTDSNEKSNQTEQESGEFSGGLRGQVIHRILQLLCDNTDISQIKQITQAEYNIDLEKKKYTKWIQEAVTVFEHKSTQTIFNPSFFSKAYSEVPLYYQHIDSPVYGIIDRLVIAQDEIIIVDYKTHTNTDQAYQTNLLEHYKAQIEYYSDGVKKLWPDKAIRPMILFTHNINLVSVANIVV